MNRAGGLLVAGIAAVFAGIGVVNLDRYIGSDPAVAIAIERLNAVPLTIGPWQGRETPIDPAQLRVAEAEANLSRTYLRADRREAVAVLVLYGRSGPLGAHTPEVCYGSAGYEPIGEPTRIRPNAINGWKPGELWTGRFEKASFPPERIQVTWAWGEGDSWQALDNPRVELVASNRVYKLYVSRALPPGGEPTTATPANDEFLTVFLPVLRASLVGPRATDLSPAPADASGITVATNGKESR